MADFTRGTPVECKRLNTIFLIDVSGTMGEDNKIDSVNYAMQSALEILMEKMDKVATTQVFVNVLTFGHNEEPECRWMCEEMTPLNSFRWDTLVAEGRTPLGEAYFELDRKLTRDAFMNSPSGSFAPVLILIGDGMPNNRQTAAKGLKRLMSNSWFVNAERMALGIGMKDDDTYFFQEFVKGSTNGRVFTKASDATQLINSIEEIVVNTTMIGATRLKDSSNFEEKIEKVGEENAGDDGPVKGSDETCESEPEAEQQGQTESSDNPIGGALEEEDDESEGDQ